MSDVINNKNQSATDVIDLDLSALRKKRFRIDGDDNRILELNTSDVGIAPRLSEAYPKLLALQENLGNLPSVPENAVELQDGLAAVGKAFKQIDDEMRELIDYIFDSNVSEICVPSGSMYDPINGTFRYEFIIDTLFKLYEATIKAETQKMRQRIQKHTAKYTKCRK